MLQPLLLPSLQLLQLLHHCSCCSCCITAAAAAVGAAAVSTGAVAAAAVQVSVPHHKGLMLLLVELWVQLLLPPELQTKAQAACTENNSKLHTKPGIGSCSINAHHVVAAHGPLAIQFAAG